MARASNNGVSGDHAMTDEQQFADFIQRIRTGDEQAAVDLVRRYETTIRIEVRAHLTDPSLYRLFDSMDICQSVLASFFVRAAAGDYELENPRQLLKLLVGITRNKVAFQARKHRTQRRDNRRQVRDDLQDLDIADRTPPPDRLAEGQNLLREVRDRLNDEERKVADLRGIGKSWPEIAEELGGTAEARRKQLTRALDRVAEELGLEEELGGEA
jgi:RNA polymerase sigma-70 factor (ECF subfamily)